MRRMSIGIVVMFLLVVVVGGSGFAQQSFRPLSLVNGENSTTSVQANALKAVSQPPNPLALNPQAAVGSPTNLRFQPGNVISTSQAPGLILLWDAPTTPPGGAFYYTISVLLPDGNVDTIQTPITSTTYMPFTSSPMILAGPYVFSIYATIHGVGSSETVQTTLTIQNVAPSPTPILPVGEPYDLRFEMDGKTLEDTPDVYLKDVTKLWIKWEQPLRPQGAVFTYDIELLYPTGLNDQTLDYADTSFQPLSQGWTASLVNREFVFRIRAKVAGVGESYTLQRSFWVRPDPIMPPTPTPVPQNPDINRDNSTNMTDVMLFALSYRTDVSQNAFEPMADYKTDGKIDAKDLLYFYTLYKSKQSQSTSTPVWLYAEVPVMQANDFGMCEEISKKVVTLPPNEITFGVKKSEAVGNEYLCGFPTFMNTFFYFSEVPGADDYYLTLRNSDTGEILRENISTNGQTSFNYFATIKTNTWYLFEIQPHFPNSGLGNKSEPLLFQIAQ